MRIAELSERSGVARATVKFYLREGLLPPGTPVARNQAEYDERHLARLRLIRALVDVGGLSLAAVRGVVAAADDGALSAHEAFAVAYRALGAGATADTAEDVAEARREVDAWIERRGWTIDPDAPMRTALATALATSRRFGFPGLLDAADGFAALLGPIAASEVAFVEPGGPRDRMVEQVVVGTLVYEQALLATRRLLLEHESAQRFGAP